MPAYKRDIRQRCAWPSCDLRANFEAFNHVNSSMGFYCQRHIDLRLREIDRSLADARRQ